MSQWQWLRSSFESPNFSEPKSSPTGARRQPAQDQPRAILEPPDRDAATRDGRRTSCPHERAIGNGFGDRGEIFRRLQQRRRSHRGARFAKSNVVGFNDAQARKTEVRHSAGGSADVERVAGLHEDNAQVLFPGCDGLMLTDVPLRCRYQLIPFIGYNDPGCSNHVISAKSLAAIALLPSR